MDLELTDKTALVTGASKGIGLATAARLAAEGVRVVAAARNPSGPVTEIDGVVPLGVDLTAPDAAAWLVAQAEGLVGDLDIVVNNVGGVLPESMAATSFLDIDDGTWQRTYELNLFSAVRVTRAALPGLLRRRGTVINVSSIGARAAYHPVDYGTAKAALTNLTKALAEEFGSRGLRALTVTPGPTRTANWSDPDGYAGQLARTRGIDLDHFMADAANTMRLTTGRLSEPDEIAALITFLASPVVANLTGADYLADGGAIKAV